MTGQRARGRARSPRAVSSRGLLGQGALAGAGPGSRGGARRVVLGARDGVHAEEAEHHLALLVPPAQFHGGALVSRPRGINFVLLEDAVRHRRCVLHVLKGGQLQEQTSTCRLRWTRSHSLTAESIGPERARTGGWPACARPGRGPGRPPRGGRCPTPQCRSCPAARLQEHRLVTGEPGVMAGSEGFLGRGQKAPRGHLPCPRAASPGA